MTADTATGRYGDAAIARRVVAWGPGVLSSADQGLARGRIELDHVIVRSLARSDVVDGAHDHDHPNERLEDGDGWQLVEQLPTHLQECIDERVGPRVAEIASEVTKGRRRPDADVDDHGAAPDQREDVEDGAPCSKAEPSTLVRPSTGPGGENAEVAQEVAQVDRACCRNRKHDGTAGTGDDEGNRRQDSDSNRGVSRCL